MRKPKELRTDPQSGPAREDHGGERLPATHSMTPLSLPPAGSSGHLAGGLAPQPLSFATCL
jgi:hypothetical protein